MAKKEKALERVYTIPLRKEFSKVARWRRSQKAVKAIKEFLRKHMKTEDVILSKNINERIWAKGSKGPPSKIKVQAIKKDDKIKVELFGVKIEVKKEEKKPEPKKEEKTEEEKKEEKEIAKKKRKEEEMTRPTLKSRMKHG